MYAQFFTHLILWSFGFFLQLSLLTQFKTWQQLLTHTNLQWHWNGIHRPMLDIQEMSLNIRFNSGTRRIATMWREWIWTDLPLPLSSQESQGSDHWLLPLLKWEPAVVMMSAKSGWRCQHLLVCRVMTLVKEIWYIKYLQWVLNKLDWTDYWITGLDTTWPQDYILQDNYWLSIYLN